MQISNFDDFVPIESPESQLSIGTKIIKFGSLYQKLWQFRNVVLDLQNLGETVVGTYVRPRTVSASVRRGGFNCVCSTLVVDDGRLLGGRALDALVRGDNMITLTH